MNRVLWDTIKLTNMHIMGKHFPILMKNINLHMQEVQQKSRRNSKSCVLVRILQKIRTDRICEFVSVWAVIKMYYRKLFLTVLEVDKCKIMTLADWMWWLVRPYSLVHRLWLLTVSSHRGRLWGNLSTVSVVRASIPLRRALPLWLNHFPKASLPNTNTLGVKFQWKDLGETVALNPGSPNACPSCMKNKFIASQ